MKKRVFSLLMALMMVFSLMPTSVFAVGTAEDPYDIGDVVISDAAPTGAIPENTEWISSLTTVVTDEVICTDEEEGHVHSAEAGCYATAEKTQWTLTAKAAEIQLAETKQCAEGCTLEAGHEGDCVVAETKQCAEGCTLEAGHEGDCVVAETKQCAEGCILAVGHDGDCYVCAEGCILSGAEEHAENGWECLVWTPCTLTEGCELADGHPGECTGAGVYAGGTITVRTGSSSVVRNAYVVVGTKNNTKDDTLYQTNNSGVICDLNGNPVTFAEGSYYIWYGTEGHTASRSFYYGSVTVDGNETITLTGTTRNSKASTVSAITEDQWNWATCVYYNTDICDHIHIRVDGSYTIDIGGTTYEASVSNPSMKVYVNGGTTPYYEKSWTGTTSYEWTYKTDISLDSEIEVHLFIDLTYYDAAQRKNVTIEDVEVVYNNKTNLNKWIEFIAICDGIQGFDFTVSVQDVQEVITYNSVYYEWKVYNADGTYTSLPVGAPSAPGSVSGIQQETEYVYNTGYMQGSSFYDYETGLLYTFHGWDTYSHSSTYNVSPNGTTYIALDDGDQNASNNSTIKITADTYIYGCWTVSKLPTSTAYIQIDKVFQIDLNNDGDATDTAVTLGNGTYNETNVTTANIRALVVAGFTQFSGFLEIMTNDEHAENLYFQVVTGYDGDGDGNTTVDIDYPQIAAEDNGYQLAVYQYETPFVITENNENAVAGYNCTNVAIALTGNTYTYPDGTTETTAAMTTDGKTATVTLNEVYDEEADDTAVNLGTITYTNTYVRNTGTAVSVYPSLYLLKMPADGGNAQSGAVFTLYSDENCSTVVSTHTTDEYGQLTIDFADKNVGTYYLKETVAPTGYQLDPCVYAITLSVEKTAEELRDNAFVTVTYYALSVAVPEDSTASYTPNTTSGTHSLVVYDEPIVGSLTLTKTFDFGDGITTDDIEDFDTDYFKFHVHGPITRDAETKAITNMGTERVVTLYGKDLEDGKLSASLTNLPVGEYLIHEVFASVHGFYWEGTTYSGDEGTAISTLKGSEYTYQVIEVAEDSDEWNVFAENNYVQYEVSDFRIHKVDANGSHLAGAVFQLYTDAACTTKAEGDFTTAATTGTDGYAYFGNFTVPEGTQDGTVTYYLKETQAPAGYYLDNTVYKVVISTDDTEHDYDPAISLLSTAAENWDATQDVLTVTNEPVTGKLTITKAIVGPVGDSVTSVSVAVAGPNGYSTTVELNNSNSWSAELTGLALGTYTITEQDANVPGYTWAVTYSGRSVTLSAENLSSAYKIVDGDGNTVYGANDSNTAAVAITNTYTKNETTVTNPTSLMVKKVGEDGTTPLSGAVFRLTSKRTGDYRQYTTNADGYAIFDMLQGSVSGALDAAYEYTLEEITAPAGYVKSDTTWTVTVREDDGQLRVVLNANKNVFENIWDWIVGGITGAEDSYVYVAATEDTPAAVTVKNVKKTGDLTVTKTVVDEEAHYDDAEYSFTLDFSDDTFDRTFTLKAGETYTVKEIPWGTAYTLTEASDDAAFTSIINDAGNGTIWADATAIEVTNTYAYTYHNEGLNLVKVDAEDNTIVIEGAGFTLYADKDCREEIGAEVFSDDDGAVLLPIEAEGTYYLKETTTPDGYSPDDTVYEVTAEQEYAVKDAGTANAITEIRMHIRVKGLTGETTNEIDYLYKIENIKRVNVHVTKIWEVPDDYSDIPKSAEVRLLRDGEAYGDPVKLSKDNGWSYEWEDLPGNYEWSVEEVNVSEDYTVKYAARDNDWTITNTLDYDLENVSVSKVWLNPKDFDKQPTSVAVVLYRDGEAYETVTLSKDNNWSHKWTNLPDCFEWTVDEPNVPKDYAKKVTHVANAWVITNAHKQVPVTGDDSNGLLWAGVAGVAVVGLVVTLVVLLKKRKEEDDRT